MKEDPAAEAPAHEPLRCDETVACEECGRFGAYDFAGRKLCAECYQAGCSCCAEFGKDDLWAGRDAEPGSGRESGPG